MALAVKIRKIISEHKGSRAPKKKKKKNMKLKNIRSQLLFAECFQVYFPAL